MANVRRYWQEVRSIQGTLPEFVWLAGAVDGGSVVQVSAAKAAQLLHAKSHRLAEQAEIDAHLANEQSVNRAIRLEGLRREGVAIVPVNG
jgi:hypothetical protein